MWLLCNGYDNVSVAVSAFAKRDWGIW